MDRFYNPSDNNSSDNNSDNNSDDSYNDDFNLSQQDLQLRRNRMNLELEAISVNQLHRLANQAVDKKLISAHGYHNGQYELLREGEFLLLSPTDAITYLQTLLKDHPTA